MAQRRTTTHDERRWAGGAGADGACCDAFALRACNARVSVGCSRKLLRGTTELACMSVCMQSVCSMHARRTESEVLYLAYMTNRSISEVNIVRSSRKETRCNLPNSTTQ